VSENAKDGFIAFIIALALIVVVGMALVAREQMWTDGYCAALGGERITQYACEVEGKVIRA
jgi:hypothetical protein